MINDKLIDVFLQNAEQEDLIRGIKEILNHLKIENSYNYEEVLNNIINIIGGDKITTIEDINIDFIKDNINNILYRAEEIDKDSIEISDIDIIDNTIKIMYKRECNDYKNHDRIKYTDYLKMVKEN